MYTSCCNICSPSYLPPKSELPYPKVSLLLYCSKSYPTDYTHTYKCTHIYSQVTTHITYHRTTAVYQARSSECTKYNEGKILKYLWSDSSLKSDQSWKNWKAHFFVLFIFCCFLAMHSLVSHFLLLHINWHSFSWPSILEFLRDYCWKQQHSHVKKRNK